MRRKRLQGTGHHFIHALSRVVDRQRIFGKEEKDYFAKLVRDQSKFTGVRVVTNTIVSNHFHLLLEQIDFWERSSMPRLSWDELRERLSAIYGEKQVQSYENEYHNLLKINDPDLIDAFFEKFERRMYDVSIFMKEVKQKFTQWYNLRNGRKGTLWEGRFKSVIVEGSQQTLMVMAAYIDLNPVRAGMVSRVEDYKWCGYTAAVGGDEQAQRGLGLMLDYSHHVSGEDFEKQWQETAKLYRRWLYHQGREVTGDSAQGTKAKKGFSAEEIDLVERSEGDLTIEVALRSRVSELSQCRAFGSNEFVDQIYQHNKSIAGASSSRNSVRRLGGCHWESFRVM